MSHPPLQNPGSLGTSAAVHHSPLLARLGGGEEGGVLAAKGRHDPCVVPRAIPIVEGMAAIVIMDALMAQHARQMTRSLLPPVKKPEA
ncbi:hypothetical protein BN1708_010701, partial [Verticillium longisporum]